MFEFDDKDAIWYSQSRYLSGFNYFAHSVFSPIDRELKSEIFLVGIDNKASRQPVTVPYYYPRNQRQSEVSKPPVRIVQKYSNYPVSLFDPIFEIAKQLGSQETEGYKDTFRSTKADFSTIRASLMKILEEELNSNGKEIYISNESSLKTPAEIGGYSMYAILLLPKEILLKHRFLVKMETDARKISPSLVDTLASLFLDECVLALRDPFKDFLGSVIERSPDELLRKAGIAFMYSVSRSVGHYGERNLYETCNLISSSRYEGAEGIGQILLAKKDHPALQMVLQLDSPFSVSDFRKVRKFLEMSTPELLVVCDGNRITGLSKKPVTYDPSEQSLFFIDFSGHYKWKVLHDEKLLLSVEYNQPVIERKKIDGDKFRTDLGRIFNGISTQQVEKLWSLVSVGVKQKHGTMLVITDKAASEAQRLGSQSFAIKPVSITDDMMLPLTAIDGSVLLDRNGDCHAIGVILDGAATHHGDSSRGARFNSSIKYYRANLETALLIIIISEDGMINLVPDLKPRISHAQILANIQELEELAKDLDPSQQVFYNLMSYFERFEFYLTANECLVVNENRSIVEANIKDLLSISFFKDELKPNEDMNPSFYLDESS